MEYADVNAQMQLGLTPLMSAASNGNIKTVMILLNSGAKINDRDRLGNNALTFAVKRNHYEVVKLLLNKSAKISIPKHYSMQNYQNLFGKEVPETSLEVEFRYKVGWSPLMIAAENGNLEMAKLLLQNDANVNEQDVFGVTALMVAAYNGYEKIVELFLKNDADLHLADNKDRSAFFRAKKKNHPNIVGILKK